jgi:hypothetical protein
MLAWSMPLLCAQRYVVGACGICMAKPAIDESGKCSYMNHLHVYAAAGGTRADGHACAYR